MYLTYIFGLYISRVFQRSGIQVKYIKKLSMGQSICGLTINFHGDKGFRIDEHKKSGSLQ